MEWLGTEPGRLHSPGSQEAGNPLALSPTKKTQVGAEGALGEMGIVCCFNPDT